MTQEEKQLLLVDLCGRLPYGVKVWYKYYSENVTEKFATSIRLVDGKIALSSKFNREGDWYPVEEANELLIKPYLRPISSMTEEEMDKLFDILHIDKDGKDEDWIKINDVYGIKFFFPTGKWVEDVADAYDYLNSIHIDYRGLIPKGLAIEVTEENNPYKE